jgi:hypothetical protein
MANPQFSDPLTESFLWRRESWCPPGTRRGFLHIQERPPNNLGGYRFPSRLLKMKTKERPSAGRKPITPIHRLRVRTWYLGVRHASNKTKWALEAEFPPEGQPIRRKDENKETRQRSQYWSKYQAGTATPRKERLDLGGGTLVDAVDRKYPGTKLVFEHALWEVLEYKDAKFWMSPAPRSLPETALAALETGSWMLLPPPHSEGSCSIAIPNQWSPTLASYREVSSIDVPSRLLIVNADWQLIDVVRVLLEILIFATVRGRKMNDLRLFCSVYQSLESCLPNLRNDSVWQLAAPYVEAAMEKHLELQMRHRF